MNSLKSAFSNLWTAKPWFRTAVVVVAFGSPWLLLAMSSPARNPIGVAVDLAALSFVAAAIIHASWDGFSSVRAKIRSVLTLVAVVNLAAAEFAYAYWSVAHRNVDAFSEPLDRAGAAYLSVATFTRVDANGLAPMSSEARMIATGQMGLGIAALAIGLASVLGAKARRNGA